jgi:hypothetical protein
MGHANLIPLVIIIILLWVVGRFLFRLWPILTKFVSFVNAGADLPQFMITTAATLHQQDEKLADIHHEMWPNNGSSMKDAIKRVEDNQATALVELSRIPAIEEGVAGLYERVDTLDVDAKKDRANIEANRQEIENTRPRPPKGTP